MAEYKDNLLGEANSFLEVLEQVSHLAPLDKPVLIIGERGWIPNCLVTKRGRLPVRKNVIQGDLNVPTAVRYFLMNSLRHR